MASALPTGTVTFLLTDVEESSRLWEHHPASMGLALSRHDELIEQLAAEHGGTLVRPRGEGDSRFAVFARASDGVAAAYAIHYALHTEPWPLPEPVRAQKCAGGQAARSYTWCRPPSTGRDRAGPLPARSTGTGVSRRSVRCGRSRL
jgi:class 3 adenylate cyclase